VAKARRIQEELEARRCLLAVAASGRPLAEWARENGIDGRSLNAWRVNLGRREANAAKAQPAKAPVRHPRSGLVELVASSRPTMAPRGAGHYVLEVDGARVEFGDDFQEETLRRIVTVLRAC
jgi:hypothetical protein